jgi:hypothetical protein
VDAGNHAGHAGPAVKLDVAHGQEPYAARAKAREQAKNDIR